MKLLDKYTYILFEVIGVRHEPKPHAEHSVTTVDLVGPAPPILVTQNPHVLVASGPHLILATPVLLKIDGLNC
jgi:hypothetical protein